MRIKWKLFLPTWLTLILLAPSIIFPQALMRYRNHYASYGLPFRRGAK